jgi:uncharacterized caspase-like protein
MERKMVLRVRQTAFAEVAKRQVTDVAQIIGPRRNGHLGRKKRLNPRLTSSWWMTAPLWVLLFLLMTLTMTPAVIEAAAQSNAPQRTTGRVALLIGNGNYPDRGDPLKEPINDSTDLAEELRRLGFQVDVQQNLTKDAMRRALDRFYNAISSGSVALLFFSGYGIQSNRQTYLIPVDAQIWSEADVRRDGINLDSVLAEMNSRNANIKVAVIDASRRNPFERRFRIPQGLAPVVTPRGSLVMYSTEPNLTANDSGLERSVFVSELINQVRAPGLTLQEIFNRTQAAVNRASQGEQLPFISNSLIDDVSLALDQQQAAPTPVPQRAPQPTITGVAPSTGTSAGGTSVTISGSNFKDATAVSFAGVAATRFTVESTSSITAMTAAHAAGAADVTVTTPSGSATAGSAFTYLQQPVSPPSPLPRPTISRLAPSSGDAAGGTSVTITGANLGGVTTMTFGGVVASTFRVNSSSSITATTPAHASGTVDVAATSPQGTAIAKSAFTYAAPAPPVSAGRCGTDSKLAELNTQLQRNPDDVSARYNRGVLCAKNNDLKAALEDFDEVIRRNPQDADALNDSCWVHALIGDLDVALQRCDEALKIRPEYVDALDSRGLVKLKLSLYASAIDDYDAALKLNPKQASSLYGRGIAKLRSGKPSAGDSDVAAAKALRPAIADEFASYGIR